MGVEPSKKAFVHYPAGTYPGQNRVLADNTHFNPYGAYQISKCIIEGIKKAGLPISNYLRSDYSGYNPCLLYTSLPTGKVNVFCCFWNVPI